MTLTLTPDTEVDPWIKLKIRNHNPLPLPLALPPALPFSLTLTLTKAIADKAAADKKLQKIEKKRNDAQV